MALSKSPYRGTRDFFPKDMRGRNYIFKKMAEVSERFAYEPYDGPMLEEVELYRAKSGDELINDQIYSFTERGEREVAIRPEMTPTVARKVAQIHREVAKPLRWYAIPNLMRYEKPQRGRLREFWQYNADIFGAGQDGEVEILQLAVEMMKSFGASGEHFEILVNDRRFVDFVFEGLIGLGPGPTKKLYKLVDSKNKMPLDKFAAEVRSLTGDEDKAKVFESFVNLRSIEDVRRFVDEIFSNVSVSDMHHFKSSAPVSVSSHIAPLYKIFEKIEAAGIGEYVRFDPSIVRGLDYYTGLVFEIFDKHPENRRAIAGGGAYANLLQIFDETPLEGVGMGLGEVPLTDFLVTHKLLPDFSKAVLDYLVGAFVPEGEAKATEIATKLRAQGSKVELFFGDAKPKKFFNYSEKKNFKYLVFVTETELKLRNVATRVETTVTLQDLTEGKR
jgi:histidyl-tRNA synthetase